jgi:hypothetical protein
MKMIDKKVYIAPETASEQFLGLMGMLMDSSEFGKTDVENPSGFHAPKREVF